MSPLSPPIPSQGTGKWYELQDLQVTDILPQMITLSEAYIQVRGFGEQGGGPGGRLSPPQIVSLPHLDPLFPALPQIWKRREEDETNQQGA